MDRALVVILTNLKGKGGLSFFSSLLDTARSVKAFPFAGRVVPELDDTNTRERFVYSYRIIYRIEETMVTVAAVIHGKGLLDSELLGKASSAIGRHLRPKPD